VVVGHLVRVRVDLGVGDGDVEQVAERLEVGRCQLLHLVGGVAGLEVGAEAVSLDGLGENHRGPSGGVSYGRRVVGGIHLPVIVAAPLETPNLVVGEVSDQSLGRRGLAEEVLADVATGLALVRLVVPVQGLVHDPHELALGVPGEQRVPLPPPEHLHDVPARTAEEALELLDDLAVATDGPVEPLEVAVDDEGEVVQALVRRELQEAARLRLVHLAVPEERPDPLVTRIFDLSVEQVAVQLGLVDRVHRADAHGDGRKLPELRHQSRVRIGGQPVRRRRLLLAEAVEVSL